MLKEEGKLIVVTGGAGFIGSCTVRHLNDLGIGNIVIVDALGQGEKWKNLVGKRFLDVIPKSEIFDWLKGKESLIRAFIHLGACADTTERNADYLLQNNYHYTVQLATYALKNGHRFIYASSAATYGDGAEGFVDDEQRLDRLHPLNMYGFSKHLFDLWAFQRGALQSIVGLKFFNVFGPNEHHKGKMASAITRMVPQILKGESVKLFKSQNLSRFADGEQKRDFVYVKDVVRMICLFLTNKAGGIYNVGSGVASSWNALALAVYDALGRRENIEYIEMPAELFGKYQDFSQADMSKTVQLLQANASCLPLKEAVADYVKNHLMRGFLW